MAINIKDAEEKLGKDKIEEITEKEWSKAELPSEDELASEETNNPKARSNLNSRKNLIQYREKTKEQKEKALQNLKFVEKEEDVVPGDILGKFTSIKAIEKLMPALDVLADRQEQEIYYNYIKFILEDFDETDLTSSDIDDVITLALNRVIEIRLLKGSAKNPLRLLEAAPTIEKFRKFSEKVKSNLASRRVDRIDVKNKPAFSIVDLAAQLDDQKKSDFDKRIAEMEASRDGYEPPPRDDTGLLTDEPNDT